MRSAMLRGSELHQDICASSVAQMLSSCGLLSLKLHRVNDSHLKGHLWVFIAGFYSSLCFI